MLNVSALDEFRHTTWLVLRTGERFDARFDRLAGHGDDHLAHRLIRGDSLMRLGDVVEGEDRIDDRSKVAGVEQRVFIDTK